MSSEEIALELIKLHEKQLTNDVKATVEAYLKILDRIRSHEYDYHFDKQVEEELK